jgi:hypothetical protein
LNFHPLLCYVVVGFKGVPILFTFECLGDGGIATNIKAINFFALMTCGDLFQDYIVRYLVCLGGDGAFKFQGVKFEDVALMRMEQAP